MSAVIAVQMITEIARIGHHARRTIRPMSENIEPNGRMPLPVNGLLGGGEGGRVAPGCGRGGCARPLRPTRWPGAERLGNGGIGRQGCSTMPVAGGCTAASVAAGGPVRVYSLHPIPLHQRRPPVPSGFGYQPAGGRSLLMTQG